MAFGRSFVVRTHRQFSQRRRRRIIRVLAGAGGRGGGKGIYGSLRFGAWLLSTARSREIARNHVILALAARFKRQNTAKACKHTTCGTPKVLSMTLFTDDE